MELGSAGPSIVARELAVGLSTAYRDLASLEEAGLIVADESGKRALTERGVTLLDTILK
jgi:Mn-dependent DtxR family transcriptional regulator